MTGDCWRCGDFSLLTEDPLVKDELMTICYDCAEERETIADEYEELRNNAKDR